MQPPRGRIRPSTDRAIAVIAHLPRVVIALLLSSLLLFTVACNERGDLRDIERGRDTRPAIDSSPPDEAN